MRSPVDCLVEVGVVEDDVGRLATELEGDVLQVALGGGLHNLATDQSTTSEGDLINLHVGGDGGTDGVSVAVADVDETRREAGF